MIAEARLSFREGRARQNPAYRLIRQFLNVLIVCQPSNRRLTNRLTIPVVSPDETGQVLEATFRFATNRDLSPCGQKLRPDATQTKRRQPRIGSSVKRRGRNELRWPTVPCPGKPDILDGLLDLLFRKIDGNASQGPADQNCGLQDATFRRKGETC